MPLDVVRVGSQVQELSAYLESRRGFHLNRLPIASEALAAQAQNWESLAKIAADASRRMATPVEPLDLAVDPPEAPTDYRVLATDGSQIEPDHHGIAEYFLINLGTVSITYGNSPTAELGNTPYLYFRDEDRFISGGGNRRVPVQDGHLAAKRSVMELEAVVALAVAERDSEIPVLTLQDGTLLLWVLEQRPDDFIREKLLSEYVKQLDALRYLNVPVASYISRPRSTEVSGLLREATCGGQVDRCGSCAGLGENCALEALHDRDLFRFLQIGQRSARFAVTLSRDIGKYYEGHRIHFFFVRIDDDEIARVEVPEWIAQDEVALGLVHTLVLDQCDRGLGYPVAIARAHEKAIVSGSDRTIVQSMIQAGLLRAGLNAATSAKLSSKRVHGV